MLTDKQRAAGFAAAHEYILARMRAEVPSMFEKQAESALETHRDEIQTLVDHVGGAIIAAGGGQ